MKCRLWQNYGRIKLRCLIQRNFSHCIGAIDRRNIKIVKSTRTGGQDFNYKHYFSIVLLAVVDTNYTFLYINVGFYRKYSDLTIFKNFTLWSLLTWTKLNIPEACPIVNTNIIENHVLVDDEAFNFFEYIQRPYSKRNFTQKKNVYLIIDTPVHNMGTFVQCAFGILSNKWRFFIDH